MREHEWTRVLGWPGYKVYRMEIDERDKHLKLWVRRKKTGLKLICSRCGQHVPAATIHEVCERAAARQVARRMGLAASTVRAMDLRYLERWDAKRRQPPLRQMGVDEI